MQILVELEITDGVAIVRLVRPERMNAFNRDLHEALRGALDRVESDGALRALVVTGAGPCFSAGADLAERAATFGRGEVPQLGELLAEYFNPLISRLTALPYPVVAAVNGMASGAGLALALACDLILAAKSARFQCSFIRVALSPDAGTSWLLPRRVGQGRALALALTGEPVSADRALEMGLCDQVVPDEELMEQAIAFARGFANGPAEATRTIKRTMRSEAPASLEYALEAERVSQQALAHHPDYREAVAAFADKRPPNFAKGL